MDIVKDTKTQEEHFACFPPYLQRAIIELQEKLSVFEKKSISLRKQLKNTKSNKARARIIKKITRISEEIEKLVPTTVDEE